MKGVSPVRTLTQYEVAWNMYRAGSTIGQRTKRKPWYCSSYLNYLPLAPQALY